MTIEHNKGAVERSTAPFYLPRFPSICQTDIRYAYFFLIRRISSRIIFSVDLSLAKTELSPCSGIGIAHLPLLVAGLCESAPSPEVAACEASASFHVVGHELEYIFIVAVAGFCGRSWSETEPIAGIAEFFHDERFLDFLADLQVAVDVVAGVLTRALHVFPERVFFGPAPVVRPQVDVAIVDVGIRA